jgi:hypothetical protein
MPVLFEITREYFIKATGREPIQDDLERSNCLLAGTMGHNFCGWNQKHNKPQYEIGYVDNAKDTGK